MAFPSSHLLFLCAIGIILIATPVDAFGAGNIGSTSSIEGQNWRHGDLEDTLLTIVASRAMGGKKFGKLDVKRVYFGNWLRDYSQAVDVGTVKYVSAEAIRILLWVLGFMSFGYGSGEFEVTTERLGCYRPEEHIDNPKDYADNEDARQYDRRLRGPVNEGKELGINPRTGLKNYIASEDMGIDTSAGLVRQLFGRSIQLGRQYARNKNKRDLYEALRLLGTGCHCLEDYSAHSNYVELALIELGERDVFPHVGRRTTIQLQGANHSVYPIVTGTFGGVDFLHSVCGEFDDKVTQSEIQELEGTMQQYQNSNSDESILQDLLNNIPSGMFGGKDEAGKASELKQNAVAHQMQNSQISPRQPEQWTRYLNDVQKQILPIIEWHDEIMQSITETIEKIPILPALLEQVQDEINKFVFSLIAPLVIPVINQVKNELNTGSSEIIQSSLDKQHIVFNDDRSSDPTHSMLSKDHFSNVLNEAAGKVASQTIKWVVPQLIACWDDERIDVDRTLNRIIHGVLHHPALRDYGQDGASDGRRLMFGVVERWWREKDEGEKDELREQLSRDGVESGRNHKPGVQDHGHGSGHPLAMTSLTGNRSLGVGGEALDAISSVMGGSQGGMQSSMGNGFGNLAGEAVGGGALGALVGGLAGELGGDILGGGFNENRQTYKRESYGQDGSYGETVTQMGQSGNRYGQAQYSRIEEPSGATYEEIDRFEQRETSSGQWQSEVRREERTNDGWSHEETRRYGSGYDQDQSERYNQNQSSYENQERLFEQENQFETRNRRNDYEESDNRRNESYGRRQEETEYGSGFERQEYGREERESGYERREYDRQEERGSGFGGEYAREEERETGYGRQERQNEYENEYEGRRDEQEEYGRNEQEEYGRDESSTRRDEEEYERY